ncbi:MAG: 2-aminoethylphosphonate--pyruvate transaminase [Pseudomonadota bacterium]
MGAFVRNLPYCGQVQAVVLDWAGTAVDFGSVGPLAVFVDVFKAHGVAVTIAEARQFMGLMKKDHIRAMCRLESVTVKWKAAHGREPDENDVEIMYSEMEKQMLAVIARHAEPIPGLLDTVTALRGMGIKIGSSTGYTGSMMAILTQEAAQKGYAPDAMVCSTDVPAGRPFPYMCYENAVKLGVYPMEAMVKIGDTISDIQEGLNAGMWTIGLTLSGNELGLTRKEVEALDPGDLKARLETIEQRYRLAGAHFTARGIWECLPVIHTINGFLSRGELPLFMEKRPAQDNPYLLLTPGPLSTTASVKQVMLRDWCTWDEDYNRIVQDIRYRLVSLATRSGGYTSVLMQGSGTFSVEAAITTALPHDGKLLVLANGAYGRRMARIADRYRIDHTVLDSGEVLPPDLIELDRVLKLDRAITHVAVVHCETTTGMLNPVQAIGEVVKAHGRIYMVDAMSSFGGIPMDMAEIGADFLISSANKCIQGVPGFGFVIARTEVLAGCRDQARTFSLDLFDQWETMENHGGKWRFTSPTHTVRAFAQALKELAAEGGVVRRNQRYTASHDTLVEGMGRLGFVSLLPREYRSPIITAFLDPESPDYEFRRFYSLLKDRGFVIYPGKVTEQDTFRIGTIGDVRSGHISALLEAVKDSMFWNRA